MNEVMQSISEAGILPVVKLNGSDKAVPLAKALYAGGIPVAEITFRTAAAADSIRAIAAQVPEVLVGAGTVVAVEQAQAAVDAGARFIVSPGFSPKVVEWCVGHNIPITPGCSSPSEVEAAMGYGLSIVKFFPAEAVGGVKLLKSLAAPYPQMRFVPTGGINEENLNAYLSLPNVVACGGSWMVPEKSIDSGNFDEITQLSRAAVLRMLGFELISVGTYAQDNEALEIAKRFAAMFSMPVSLNGNTATAGHVLEVQQSGREGETGYIVMGTNFMHRALAYLRHTGVGADESTAIQDNKGRISAVRLKERVGSLGVWLRTK